MITRRAGLTSALAFAVGCSTKPTDLLKELLTHSQNDGWAIGESRGRSIVLRYFDKSTQSIPSPSESTLCTLGTRDLIVWHEHGRITLSTIDGTKLSTPPIHILNAYPAALSPDRSAFAFVGTNKDAKVTGLQILNLESFETTPIFETDRWPPADPNTRRGTIEWSPNGDRLVYARNGAVHLFDRRSNASTLLLENAENPLWSPSGEWISCRRPNGEALLLNAQTRRLRQFLAKTKIVHALHWSPDSAYVLFSDRGAASVRIRVGRLRDDATETILEHFAGPDDQPFEWVILKRL